MQDAGGMLSPPGIVAVALMAACLCMDLRTKQIPNLLTVPFACGGVLYHSMTLGLPAGGLFALKGLGLGCLLLLLPFALGGMGGGDVKCLGTLGAWVGPERVFWIFLYGAMAGGLIALILLALPPSGQGHRGVWLDLKVGVLSGQWFQGTAKGQSFPYTLALAVGVAAFFLVGKAIP
ncbi:MAG: A24 family peptidase [Desulfobacteraceae bacterium]|jgi:prepilin peptidase CpaA